MLIKIVSVVWGIWFFRNKLGWENKVVTTKIVTDWSTKAILNWQTTRAKPRTQGNGTGSDSGGAQTSKWRPPVQGRVKLNVDASLFKNEHFYFVGMIFRDHLGMFIMGKMLKFAERVSVFEAESMRVYEALSWIDSLVVRDVTIECDSLLSMTAINSSKPILLEVGDVLDCCRDRLRVRSDISLVHVKKQTNKAAHLLARCPCLIGCSTVFRSPPDHLLETIMSEIIF